MVHRLIAAAVVSLLTVVNVARAGAAVMPSFETSLTDFQLQLREAAPKRAAARSQSELARLGWDADRERWEVERLRRDLDVVRRRLRNRNDPMLHSEVRQLLWRARDYAWRLDEMERRATRVRDAVKADPSLVGDADRLKSSVRWLRSDARWFESDSNWAVWDLRSAGFWFESMELEQHVRESKDSGETLERLADEIARKVRG